MVRPEVKVSKVQLDLPVLKVTKDFKVQLDQLVLKVIKDFKVQLDQLGQMVLMEPLVVKDHKVLKELQDLMEHRVTKDQ
jgi:hypothetical protein